MFKDKKIAALCTSRVYDPQRYQYIRELSNNLRRQDIYLMIYSLNSDLYWQEDTYFPEAEIFDIIPFDMIDVLVIMDENIKCKRISRSLIKQAKNKNVPVVVVDEKYEDIPSVIFDYAAGFEKVVRHIIEHHGAKKPHFMAGLEGNFFSDERIEIFKKVIAENGIEFKPSMLSYGDFWAGSAREAMKKVLDSGDIPDAVICANDIMAINAADVIKTEGYRIPQDIMVSGFDGYDEVNYFIPKITTASCGSDILAEAVSRSISEIIKTGKCEDIRVEPVFMPHGSCGCEDNPDFSKNALTRFNNGYYRYQDDIRILYDISAAMQMSTTPYDAASKLAQPITHDIHCFVYSSCFDTERNYFQNPLLKSEKYKFSLFYSAYNIGSVLQTLDRDFIAEWMDTVLQYNSPIIFNELDYLDKPLGFVCYTFKEYDITDFAKTASITNTVSMGLGGFINAMYQKYLADKVARTYRRDQLTGLYNRAGFSVELDKITENDENKGKKLTVIMADLDGLKLINDTYGHEAGDTAIADAAFVLKSSCPDHTVCVRFGGDEMLALVPGELDTDKLFRTIDEKLSKKTHEYTVSLSCGAYVTTIDRKFDITDAIKQADENMYYNKRRRKMQKK